MNQKYQGTILVLVVALVIIFIFYRNVNLVYAATVLGCIGIFFPWLGNKIHQLWMGLSKVMGYVMNRVLLSVIFFVFLLPVSLLSKVFRKDPLKAGKRADNSYFTERNFTYTKKSLEELW